MPNSFVTFFDDALYGAELLLPGINVDTVAVFDQNFNQVFQTARPVRAEIREITKPMEHPLENGQIITDYKIVLPVDIMISFVVSSIYYRNTYQEISKAYNNSTLLTVQTRANNYNNMIVAEMPHEERSDQFDAITINLKFKQIFIVAPISNFAPADPTQANTQSIGYQSGTATVLPNSPTQNATQSIQAEVR